MTKADISYDKLKSILISKGYKFYTSEMDINMIGIRSSNKKIDNWDDFFCIAYVLDGVPTLWVDDHFTTDPGIYYMQQHLLTPEGCGILAEGQYPAMWTIGLHGIHQYEAFVQINKCRAYRDRNKDNILDFDPKTIQEGLFGCNQHHGYNSQHVNNNSAMCQVHEHPEDLLISLGIAKRSIPLHGDKFTYTLINESDFK